MKLASLKSGRDGRLVVRGLRNHGDRFRSGGSFVVDGRGDFAAETFARALCCPLPPQNSINRRTSPQRDRRWRERADDPACLGLG